MPENIPYIRVFLSSPGDVSEERKIAQDVIERLPYRPALRDKVAFRVIAWDKTGADTPMLGSMSPQEAIDKGLPRPSQCDITLVIFWSRMGTRFHYNGTQYMSGTHYELMDALGSSETETLIFRRTDPPRLAADDKNGQAQYEAVDQFFRSEVFFDKDQEAIRRGVNLYKSPDDFRQKLEDYLEEITLRELNRIEHAPNKRTTSEMIAPALLSNIREARAVTWPGSPFPGLRAFSESDAPIYFGRGVETDALVERVKGSRFVAVVGASGSGKSSLVAAGLIPRLRANAVSDPEVGSKDWVYARFTPGGSDGPFAALFDAIVAAIPAVRPSPFELPRVRANFTADMIRDPESLSAMIEASLKEANAPVWAEILLFIDQFEELLTLVDTKLVSPFVRMLKAASNATRVRVVLTMRADFYGRAVETEGLADLLKDGTFPLAAPSSAALYEMIARPAEMAGMAFEESLVDRLLRETGTEPGALALLAYLLDELYQHRSPQGELTIAEYEALGGVQGAIGKRAEAVVATLPVETQSALPRLFREIVEVDARGRATRRRAPTDRLTDPALQPALDALTMARLLVSDQSEGRAPTLEVAHEALLREWERLQNWIVSAQADLLLRRQIEQAAQDWQAAAGEKKEGYLLAGGRLVEAQRWALAQGTGPVEQAFIDTSADREKRLIAAEEQRKRELQQAAERAEQATRDAQDSSERAKKATIEANSSAQRAARQRRLARVAIGAAFMIVIAAVLVGSLLTSRFSTQIAVDQAQVVTDRAMVIEANDQVSTATMALGIANNAQKAAAIQIQNANAVLTPIPVTMTYMAQNIATQVQESTNNLEIKRLAALANGMLSNPTGDANAAVLLGIRALKLGYSTEADVVLGNALDATRAKMTFTGISTINSVAFSPDGRYALTGSCGKLDANQRCTQGEARLWDVSTGRFLRAFSGNANDVTSVAFSPDGQYALTGSCGTFEPNIYACTQGETQLWETSSGKSVRTFYGHTDRVTSVVFSPDGQYILTGSDDKTALLWDVNNASQPRYTLSGHNASVNSVAFSPDGRYALTGSCGNIDTNTNICKQGEARLWEVSSGLRVHTFAGHRDSITSVAFSPDGRNILTGSADKTAQLWDVLTEQPVRVFSGHTSNVSSVAFSPDGQYVLTGSNDNTARMWAVSTGQSVHTFSGHTSIINSVAFSPDGQNILTGSCGKIDSNGYSCLQGDARLWAISNDQSPHTFSDSTAVNSVAFSPDNHYILTGSCGKFDSTQTYRCIQGKSRLWDVSSGQIVRTFYGHTNSVSSVAFSPDGQYALTGSYDGTAQLWDVNSGQSQKTFPSASGISSVAFSPDGQYVLTGSYDNTARLWDMKTANLRRTFSGHTSIIGSVAFSPDGRYVLTGSRDHTAHLWEVSSSQSLRTFNHTSSVTSVAFSPDGRYVLTGSGDKMAHLWEVSTGQLLRTFGNNSYVDSVAFSPDGRYVLIGSDDQVARLWEVSTGQPVRIFSGHRVWINSMAFSSDGRYVLTGSNDNTARLWDVKYTDFITYACTQVYRDFTAAERTQFELTDSQSTCPQFAADKLTAAASVPTVTPVTVTWTPVPVNTFPPTIIIPSDTIVPSGTPGSSLTPTASLIPSLTAESEATATLQITPLQVSQSWTPIANLTVSDTPTPTPIPTLPVDTSKAVPFTSRDNVISLMLPSGWKLDTNMRQISHSYFFTPDQPSTQGNSGLQWGIGIFIGQPDDLGRYLRISGAFASPDELLKILNKEFFSLFSQVSNQISVPIGQFNGVGEKLTIISDPNNPQEGDIRIADVHDGRWILVDYALPLWAMTDRAQLAFDFMIRSITVLSSVTGPTVTASATYTPSTTYTPSITLTPSITATPSITVTLPLTPIGDWTPIDTPTTAPTSTITPTLTSRPTS